MAAKIVQTGYGIKRPSLLVWRQTNYRTTQETLDAKKDEVVIGLKRECQPTRGKIVKRGWKGECKNPD